MHLTSKQVLWLQETYNYLGNKEGGDPLAPINPATWQSPEGDRLIHIAALRGDLVAVELLVNAGENVNAIGDMSQTPAHFAAMNQHRSVFEFLIQRGADTSIVDEFGNTPLQTWALSEAEKRKHLG